MSILNDSDSQGSLQSRLAGSLADANDLRSGGIASLVNIWQGQIDAHKLELVRLTARYGADAQETRSATARLQAAEALQPVIQAELIRTEMPVPAPDPKAFTLYGRVVDQAMTPVARALITVSIGDRNDVVTGNAGLQGEFVLTLQAQEGTTTLSIAVTDSAGAMTTFDESIELKPGGILYSEFVA